MGWQDEVQTQAILSSHNQALQVIIRKLDDLTKAVKSLTPETEDLEEDLNDLKNNSMACCIKLNDKLDKLTKEVDALVKYIIPPTAGQPVSFSVRLSSTSTLI